MTSLPRGQLDAQTFFFLGFPHGSLVKNPRAKQETQGRPLGQEDPLEKGKATHSSVLAWRIPWTEEPGGLHDLLTKQQKCFSLSTAE